MRARAHGRYGMTGCEERERRPCTREVFPECATVTVLSVHDMRSMRAARVGAQLEGTLTARGLVRVRRVVVHVRAQRDDSTGAEGCFACVSCEKGCTCMRDGCKDCPEGARSGGASLGGAHAERRGSGGC